MQSTPTSSCAYPKSGSATLNDQLAERSVVGPMFSSDKKPAVRDIEPLAGARAARDLEFGARRAEHQEPALAAQHPRWLGHAEYVPRSTRETGIMKVRPIT